MKSSLAILLIAALMLPSCAPAATQTPVEIEKIENLEMIFLTAQGTYTVVYTVNNEVTIRDILPNKSDMEFIKQRITEPGATIETRIVKDAQPHELWLEIHYWNSTYFKVIFHVDSFETIKRQKFYPN